MVWYNSLDYSKMKALSDEDFEKVILDKWSDNVKKDQDSSKGLFSYEYSLLKIHGCIQNENVVVSINPSCRYSFIHVDLAKKIKFLQIICKASWLMVTMV